MRKLLPVLLILTAAAFSLSAANTSKDLEVLAYKKAKSSTPEFSMSIIDALTGDLKTISSGDEINMSNYVNKYVDQAKTSYTDLELAKKAIFSIHASGNATGTFTCTVKFDKFARRVKIASDGTHEYSTTDIISADYYLSELQAFYSKTETAKLSGGGEIAFLENTYSQTNKITHVESYSTTAAGEDSLKFSWTVSDSTTDDYWDVRAMVAMVLRTDVYEGKKSDGTDQVPNGIYEAPIEITLVSS